MFEAVHEGCGATMMHVRKWLRILINRSLVSPPTAKRCSHIAMCCGMPHNQPSRQRSAGRYLGRSTVSTHAVLHSCCTPLQYAKFKITVTSIGPSLHDLVLDFAVAQHSADALRDSHRRVVEALRRSAFSRPATSSLPQIYGALWSWC
jgi:hypothetical protein